MEKYKGKIFSAYREGYMAHEMLQCVGEGWWDIVDRLVSDLLDMGWSGQLCDVKEKFGGLRFYINDGTDEMHYRIDAAEEESFKTCEICGKPGSPRGGSWIKTLCSDHFAART